MKKSIKELTDGMQRLCAVANRVVSSSGKVNRIEVDLMMDNLRRLYDVALRLRDESGETQADMADEALMSSTMMATRAAMGGEKVKGERLKVKGEVAAVVPESPEKLEIQGTPDVPEVPEIPDVPETPDVPEHPEPSEISKKPEHIMAEVEDDNSLMFDEVIIEPVPVHEQTTLLFDEEPVEEVKPTAIEEEKPVVVEEVVVEETPTEAVESPVVKETPAEAVESPVVKETPAEAVESPVVEETPTEAVESPVVKETPTEAEPVVTPAEEDKRQPSLRDYLRHTTEETPTMRTLGDTLGGGTTPTGTALERKVADLRTVININDKYTFMTELFRGNMKAYNEFIERLNGIADRDEAMRLVTATAEQYRWEQDSMAVRSFYKVFDKKF